ncbi:MAG: toprim domain-containing protein [Proteobacteria bacterium]|nr:toprim domain-containing protein [Pseudomonadota bacterium]
MGSDYESVKQKLDILEAIEGLTGTKAKKEGNTFRISPAPCCGHNDCFTVYPEQKSWSCFSCGEGGDIFSFIELTDKCPSKEALIKAADMCGHELQSHDHPDKEISPNNPDTIKQRIWKAAANYYHDCLYENKTALTYQKNKRGHSDTVLKKFKVGYADGNLYKHLLGLGFTHEEIESSGLVVLKHGQWRDFFYEGLFVYPWFMKNEQIGSFSCKHHTKKNSFRLCKEFQDPDCKFYNQRALSNDQVVIVEGENDLLKVADKGNHSHVIATCGQLSADQIDYLDQWIDTSGKKTIFCCFDNDQNGQKYMGMIMKAFLKYSYTDRLIKTNRRFVRIIKRRIGESEESDGGIDEMTLTSLAPEKDFEHSHLYEVETKLLTLKIISFNRNSKDIDECLKSETDTEPYFKRAMDNAGSCLLPLKEQLHTAKKWYTVMAPNDQKTKISPDEKGEIVFDYIGAVGNFFNEGDNCKFFDGQEVYTIGNNSAFNSFLYLVAGINFAQNQTKNIMAVLRALAYERGKKTVMPGWIHTDNRTIFFNLCNDHRELIKLSPHSTELVLNGINHDRILLTNSPKMKPLEWLPDASIQETLQHFKDLLINFACSNSNKYLIVCFIVNTILIDSTKAKGFRKYSGSHQSGKTSAARFESMLVYGNDDVTSSTASANYSEGSKSPLLVEDNLETDRVPYMESFLLVTATGGTRQKRKGGTDSENVYEKSNTQIIMTSIEPLLKSELVTRSIEIIFDEMYFTPDFIESTEISRQIAEHRDLIWSAFFKMVSNDILPDFHARRQKVLKKLNMEYPNHSKKRLNELFSCLYIICQELIKYIRLPYDNPDAKGYYRSADELLDCWITTQNQLSQDTTLEANPILHNLDILLNDCMRMDDEMFKQRYLFKGLKLYPDNQDNRPIGVKFIASSRDLLTAFNILAKNYGGTNPYKNTRTLTERLKDSLKTIEAEGWLYVVNECIINGDRKRSFTKYFS